MVVSWFLLLALKKVKTLLRTLQAISIFYQRRHTHECDSGKKRRKTQNFYQRLVWYTMAFSTQPQCGNYGNSLTPFFDKIFVKAALLLKSWFHEEFLQWDCFFFLFSTLCQLTLSSCCYFLMWNKLEILNHTYLGSLIGNTQCVNFRIFLPLRFYVESILIIFKPNYWHFDHLSSSEFWFLDIFDIFKCQIP